MVDYQIKLMNAANAENVFAALYKTAVLMRANGLAKDETYAQFEALHLKFSKEKDEAIDGVILDVMDCIVGWCAPQQKIYD